MGEAQSLVEHQLTPKEQEQLLYIGAFAVEHGYPPTVREIAEGLGTAGIASVHDRLTRLRELGLVEWEPNKPRTLRVTSSGAASAIVSP